MPADRPLRILCADDQIEMRNNVARLLKLEGYAVVATSNGRRALEILATEGPFDLLMLDLYMPDTDGLTVLQKLRAVPETAELPVLMVTGEKDSSILERVRQYGFSAVVVKPYRIAELLDGIAQLVKRGNSA